MKKLFISVPMKGRSVDDIQNSAIVMHKVAELMYGEELEVLPSYIIQKPPKGVNERIWYLAQSALVLAKADCFIGVYNYSCNIEDIHNGCEIEEKLAKSYGIPYKTINCREFVCFDDLRRKNN